MMGAAGSMDLWGWHLDWQDPVALLLAALCVLLSLWIRSRLSSGGGSCGGCARAAAPRPSLIPAQRLLRRHR